LKVLAWQIVRMLLDKGADLLAKTDAGQTPEVDPTEMCSGSEAGSYLRPIDFCITQL